MYMKAGIQLPLSCARAYKLPACVQILHMDVKSSNVLLTRTLTAKISDVGIAKAMSPSGGVELTQVRCRCVCSVWTGFSDPLNSHAASDLHAHINRSQRFL